MAPTSRLLPLLALAALASACAKAPIPLAASTAQVGPGKAVDASAKARARFGTGVKTEGLKLMRRTGGQVSVKAKAPSLVDLRPGCSPVGDQGKTESCFGFATADGLGEYVLRESGRFVDLSPRFIWNQSRKNQKQLDQNVAVNALTGITVIVEQGFAPEASFPTRLGIQSPADVIRQQIQEDPSEEVLQAALPIRPFLAEKLTLTNTLPELKAMLAQGRPALFFMKVHESSTRVGAKGLWPYPSSEDPYLGDHAMLCVGYNDAREELIVRNSWGKGWGDEGYAYVPYGVIDRGLVVAGFTFAP